MCGIAGFVFKKANNNKANIEYLRQMLDVLTHRGPDDWGISIHGTMPYQLQASEKITLHEFSGGTIGLGHKRLSIIDLSEHARQPMCDASGVYEIIFNGEIYNYNKLKQQLAHRYSFQTQSDTEVLLAGYIIFGKEILNMLDGMYSFAILDKEKNELFCARDHAAIKPFYYMQNEDGFSFASEPAALYEGKQSTKAIDITIAANFITTGICDHNDATFYKHVKQLKGAHFLIYDIINHKIKSIQKYWSPVKPHNTVGNHTKEEYLNVVSESVQMQLRSDVKLGSSLSGGIDSGTIVTLAGELLKEHAKEYTAITYSHTCFENDESINAKKIAHHAGMKWEPVTPTDANIQREIQEMMLAIGEPFSTLSMYAQYKVMEAAHEHGIKVMLDGQGGDEVFLGYSRVAQLIVKEHFMNGQLIKAYQELDGLKKNASLPMLPVIAGNILFSSPSLYMKKSVNKYSKFMNRDFVMGYDKEFTEDYYAPKSLVEKQADEYSKYCLPRLLKFADRNSMRFGVESRVPLLGRKVVEYGLNLPLNQRISNGWTKYIMRTSLEGKMPKEVLWDNNKRGFDIPQQYWVGILKEQLTEWILEADTGNLFNKEIIIRHLNDDRFSGDTGLWRIVSTICWMRLSNISPY
jgi:asparagine synthase (glutamine-hydrolysing)